MAEAVAGRRRLRKRVLIKPDGRYLILYEPVHPPARRLAVGSPAARV